MTISNLIKPLAWLIIFLVFNSNANSQDNIHLIGKVVDILTDSAIGFANVGIEGKSIGTISNEDGEFEFFVPTNLQNEYLSVSCMGYETYKAKISEIQNGLLEIRLEAVNIEIEEVVVSALTPEQLIRKVIEKIPENYSIKPYMSTGFYREIVKENNQPIEIIEAILEFYKSSYLDEKETDQARIIKGRNLVSKDPDVFKGLRVSGGPMGGIDYDVLKNRPSFLHFKMLKYYEYKYDNSTKYNGKTVYVIDFDQKEGVKKPLLKGKLYIDINSLALVSVNYQVSPKGIQYLKASFAERAKMKIFGMKLEYRKVNLIINYEEKEDTWYFKNVYLEAALNFKQPKSDKMALIDFSQSLIITDRNLLNVSNIPKDKQISRTSYMVDETGEYDVEFWKNYNTIKSGGELQKAIGEIEKSNQK